jgi:hypothetical protein
MYLRGDGAFGAPLILDLGAPTSGRTLLLNPTGILQVAGSGSPNHDAVFCGIYSSTSTLLSSSALNRVVDAVTPPQSVFGSCQTGLTFYGRQPTDVPYDFFIPAIGISVDVPVAARFLFVAVPDDYAPDNVSPDAAHYGINASMTTVPEPSSISLSALGLGLVALGIARQRRTVRSANDAS